MYEVPHNSFMFSSVKGILWITVQRENLPAGRFNDAAHHHVTLRFNVSKHEVEHLIGEKVTLFLSDICWDDNIEAIPVIMLSQWAGICQNIHPHITLSHREGIKPFQSNAMLAGQHRKHILGTVVEGVVEFHEFSR